MRYINWADVSNRYSQAAKQVGGAVETQASFINFAESEVDARLAPRYTVPFTPVPDLVRDLCIDLAYYKMIIQNPKQAKGLGEYLDNRFKGILDGSISLTTSLGLLGSTDKAWSSNQHGSSFGVDPPENWRVDQDWKTENQEARR